MGLSDRTCKGGSSSLLRFSVEVGPKGSVPNYETLKSVCLECERLGYDAVYLPDGLEWTDFECWTTLSHIAALTETLRLGPATTLVTYRHPTLLAKMAATLDVLSGGRLEFRLGAGGSGARIDEAHCGIALPRPSVRVGMLREGVRVIRRLWSEERITFRGRYFSVEDAVCDPKPVQRPHLPITICADGKGMLRVAAEYSDIWEASQSLDDYRSKAEAFEHYCREYGRDAGSISRAFEITVAIAESQGEAEEMAKKYQTQRAATRGYGFDPLKNAVIGSPEHCVEKITAYRRAGASSFTVYFIGLKELKPLRLFAERVIPHVKNMESLSKT